MTRAYITFDTQDTYLQIFGRGDPDHVLRYLMPFAKHVVKARLCESHRLVTRLVMWIGQHEYDERMTGTPGVPPRPVNWEEYWACHGKDRLNLDKGDRVYVVDSYSGSVETFVMDAQIPWSFMSSTAGVVTSWAKVAAQTQWEDAVRQVAGVATQQPVKTQVTAVPSSSPQKKNPFAVKRQGWP